MKPVHEEIIGLISQILESYPDLRFGQTLFNLNINQFKDQNPMANNNFELRDIHGDTDEDILKRIKDRLAIQ